MEKQIRFIMFFVLFLSSCGVSPIPNIPTSTAALVTQEPPSLQQTITPTLPILTATIEPTETPTPLDTVIPIPPDITDVSEGFLSYTGTDSIFFISETVQIEDLRLFYMTELVNAGWAWVYTDIGISQVPESQTRLLILEFKKDGDKLGILAYGPEEGGAMAFAAVGYSGYFQFISLLAGMGDSASVSRPSKEDIQPTSMQFSSPFLKFQHPSSWMAQDQLMQTFDGDDNSIYFLEAPSPPCNADFEPCFITFSDWSCNQYNPPVSIRIQSDLSGLSLEQADALRWQQLNSPSNPYVFPEDLAATGSLQTLETRIFTLANGAPAIQRIFQWKQLKLDQTIIVGSYILFLSQGGYVEFHTDYTSAEWELMKPLVEQVITSMESTP